MVYSCIACVYIIIYLLGTFKYEYIQFIELHIIKNILYMCVFIKNIANFVDQLLRPGIIVGLYIIISTSLTMVTRDDRVFKTFVSINTNETNA